MAPLTQLIEDIRQEFPDFELRIKQRSRLMRLLDWLLRVITLNHQKSFMTAYITTLGDKVYIPSTWSDLPWESRYSVLRHERVHMRQSKKYGRFWYSIFYLFFPIPILFAYGRLILEQEAYEETIRSDFQVSGLEIFDQDYENWLVAQLTGPAYFWTWVWKPTIRKWYRVTKTFIVENMI